MRETYRDLVSHPERIRGHLAGRAHARPEAVAGPFLRGAARGGRSAPNGGRVRACAAPVAPTDKPAVPVFKQYRESDGKFYFKLASADGRVLLPKPGLRHRSRRRTVGHPSESPRRPRGAGAGAGHARAGREHGRCAERVGGVVDLSASRCGAPARAGCTGAPRETHRHPHLGPRLQYGGGRPGVRRRRLAGADRCRHQQSGRRRRAGVRPRTRHRHGGR